MGAKSNILQSDLSSPSDSVGASQTPPRKIIHLDMDCFYAAVETKYRPELQGKPVGIGGPPNSRSVLCTANYEARKFGVKSAMPSSQAVRLCPQLILIPPHFELYKKESKAVRQIMERYTNLVEPLSLDEAYLDVSESRDHNGSATLIAHSIRKAIFEELNLTASAGIAPNKFLAKVASDWKKPNGQFVIKPSEVSDFVKTLKVEKLFGVGKVTAKKMHSLGLFCCADIQAQSVAQMTKWFGSRGADLKNLAFGIDTRAVDTSSERKSLTVEETYNRDLQTLQECLSKIPGLFEDFEERMNRAVASSPESVIRSFVIKLKYFDFRQTTHEASFTRRPTEKDFCDLLQRAWLRREEPVRLLGLGVRLGTDEPARNSSQLQLW